MCGGTAAPSAFALVKALTPLPTCGFVALVLVRRVTTSQWATPLPNSVSGWPESMCDRVDLRLCAASQNCEDVDQSSQVTEDGPSQNCEDAAVMRWASAYSCGVIDRRRLGSWRSRTWRGLGR